MREGIVSELEVANLAEKSVDFHCHGVGSFDFTEIHGLDLQEIEKILAQRKQRTILTLYLPKPCFVDFLNLVEIFHKGKIAGEFDHIMGFGLEGPLLASHGGTPEEGVWIPSKEQWKELAACGRKGLIYTILSPDASLANLNLTASVTWIAETLLDCAVLPAPGHFLKYDPISSAKALQSLFDVVASWGQGATITDHLFNDMPRNFKHAWRTGEEKARRDDDIKSLNLESWKLESLEEQLGSVPAIMIKNARKGLVKICQNFDGEHVDLAVVKKSVDIIGADNMIMMTDSIESKRLAGRKLHTKENSTLLYQDEGIVAAGSQNVSHQIKNMIAMGLSLAQIELITNIVPSNILNQHNELLVNAL